MGTVDYGTDSKSVVLVGIDFSPQAGDVLKAALATVREESELHLVHVLPLPPGETLGASRADRELRFVTQMDEARQLLDRMAIDVPSSVKRLAAHIRVGSPDVEIAQLANDLGAELIVVGTHGRKGLDRLVLGSVAESLVRHAPCAVLTWRAKPAPIWSLIAPPCPACVAVQKETNRTKLWCERHSERHGRAHTYYEVPDSFGVGSQTFR